MRFAVAGQRLVDEEHDTDQPDDAPSRAALAAADAFLAVPPQPAPAEARQVFGQDELVELGAALALFIGMSKVLIVLGLEPEEMATTSSPMPGSVTA